MPSFSTVRPTSRRRLRSADSRLVVSWAISTSVQVLCESPSKAVQMTARNSGCSSSLSIPALRSADPLYSTLLVTGMGVPSPLEMPPPGSPSSPRIGSPSSPGRAHPTANCTVSPGPATGSTAKLFPPPHSAPFRVSLASSPSPTTAPTLYTATGNLSTALSASQGLLTRPSIHSPTTMQLTRLRRTRRSIWTVTVASTSRQPSSSLPLRTSPRSRLAPSKSSAPRARRASPRAFRWGAGRALHRPQQRGRVGEEEPLLHRQDIRHSPLPGHVPERPSHPRPGRGVPLRPPRGRAAVWQGRDNQAPRGRRPCRPRGVWQ